MKVALQPFGIALKQYDIASRSSSKDYKRRFFFSWFSFLTFFDSLNEILSPPKISRIYFPTFQKFVLEFSLKKTISMLYMVVQTF